MRLNTGSNRRRLKFTATEGKRLSALAEISKKTLSGLLRSWTEEFVEKGSDFTPEESVIVEMVAPSELIQKAEAKARADHGVSLREIIRHRIAEL